MLFEFFIFGYLCYVILSLVFKLPHKSLQVAFVIYKFNRLTSFYLWCCSSINQIDDFLLQIYRYPIFIVVGKKDQTKASNHLNQVRIFKMGELIRLIQ